MRFQPRELVVLLGLAMSFCVAFLIQPEWNASEAHLLCDGESARMFDSMAACTVGQRPGCPCVRPENPWASVFWLCVLPSIGVAASLLLRLRGSLGAALLGGALAVAGVSALFALSRRNAFDGEAWGLGVLVVAAYIALVLGAFGTTRVITKWLTRKNTAT
jgi:hypothetical protein